MKFLIPKLLINSKIPGEGKPQPYILPIFASTKEGYKNLTKLSSVSYLESEATTEPYSNLENLYNNSKGLVVLTGTIYDLFGNMATPPVITNILKLIYDY